MSRDDPQSWGAQLFNWCLGLLFAAMALYGAVTILRTIWIYLCILACLSGIGALMWWRISSRYRGW